MSNREHLEVFVVSANENTVLLGPDSYVGQRLDLDSIDIARADQNHWTLETWPDHSDYLTGFIESKGYMDYPGLKWTVLVRQPASMAYANVIQMQRIFIGIGFVFIVIFGVIGGRISKSITLPLNEIAETANRLSRGDRVFIPRHKGIREIEMLEASLAHLISSITSAESELGEMEKLANRDSLTGLLNRRGFELYVEEVSKRVPRTNEVLIVLYMDLDGFKFVNDKFGHQIGDELLRIVALRLSECIREGEVASRIGGDEFVVILRTEHAQAKRVAMKIGIRIISALNEAIYIDGNELLIGCSIGCASWPVDGNSAVDVVRKADEALYFSKRNGKNQIRFYNEIQERNV